MLIDSEEPVSDPDKTWDHLKDRDNWEKPDGADDKQVLLMTTCMETWIVADRDTVRAHYGSSLQDSALPPLVNLEQINRKDIQDKLKHATSNCSNAYEKGKRSFEILGKLNAATLEKRLMAFKRMKEILKEKLQ